MSIENSKLMNLADGKILYDDLRGRVDAKYAKPISGIPAADLANGVIPNLEDLIDDAAGDGDTNVTWSADKIHDEIDASVIISGIQPQQQGNKLWIEENAEETYSVPTSAELMAGLSTKIDEPANEGTSGQVLTTDGNGGRSWTTPQGGRTNDYSDLINKPQINGVTLAGNKSLSDLGAASSNDVAAKYTKPANGIPASDLASGVIPDVPVQDVQINGTSILSQGVANIPVIADDSYGIPKVVNHNYGLQIRTGGELSISTPNDGQLKYLSVSTRVMSPVNMPKGVFYGLANVAGDTTQKSSSNNPGVYTESAKSAISQMLDAPETVSGTTPSITAKAGVRYICGEVATLTIVVPSTGIIDVVFESGSTATVLTVTPPTGMTVKWANGFDPTALEANTTYEINIMDGCLGVAGSWT